MGVSNTTLMIIIGLFFNYFVVYKQNRFFGNILYILLGIGTLYFGSSIAIQADAYVTTMIGVFIMLGGIMSFIYDTFFKKRNIIA